MRDNNQSFFGKPIMLRRWVGIAILLITIVATVLITMTAIDRGISSEKRDAIEHQTQCKVERRDEDASLYDV